MNIQYKDTKSGSAFAKKKKKKRFQGCLIQSYIAFRFLKRNNFLCVFLYASFTLNKDGADVTEHLVSVSLRQTILMKCLLWSRYLDTYC